jgi:hypothetical protein
MSGWFSRALIGATMVDGGTPKDLACLRILLSKGQ